MKCGHVFQIFKMTIEKSATQVTITSNLVLTCSENNIYMQLLTKQCKNKFQIPSIVDAWR